MKLGFKTPAAFIVLITCVLVLSSTYPNAGAQSSTNKTTIMNTSIPKNPIVVTPPSSVIINPFSNITTSIPVFPTLIKALRSEIHVSLNDATTNATKAVGSNSSAVTASIESTGGFLVYSIVVLDSNNNIHLVIVDPGNGKVVSNQHLPVGMIGATIMGLPPNIGGGFVPPGPGFTRFPLSGLIR